MWFQGARRKDIGNETGEESNACTEMYYRAFQSSGQPLFYFAGISEEPHEICFRTGIHKGQNQEESPLTPLYHVLRVPLYPSCLVLYLCSNGHPHYRVREAHGRSQEMHAQVHVRWPSGWHCIKLAETCTELAVQTEVGIRECQVDENIMFQYLY